MLLYPHLSFFLKVCRLNSLVLGLIEVSVIVFAKFLEVFYFYCISIWFKYFSYILMKILFTKLIS